MYIYTNDIIYVYVYYMWFFNVLFKRRLMLHPLLLLLST